MLSILYNIIISPIELVLEIIFELMFKVFGNEGTNPGLAVVGVSLAVSLLTLPLYCRADAVQQKARDIQKQLSYWINHIKRTFKGDERFMMLQGYYLISGYNPLSALNGSISLLLEIPFFIAAYHFLSHLDVLKGASFWIISDLGSPDRLMHFGAISINVLPILMTAINCIASAVYLKGFPIKDKIQTYGMAVIFLVLLYNSPAGLVVYWTCNNIFSLGKNIVYKLKRPKEASSAQSSTMGFDFILPGVFLTILFGVLIPSSVIASSPAEFINVSDYRNPFLFLVNSTCYAVGFFLVWTGIIHHMLPQNRRRVFSLLLWIFSGACLLNYMCFGRNLGSLSPLLVFDKRLLFSTSEKLINLAALGGLCVVSIALFRFRKLVLSLYIVLILCIGGLSAVQIHTGLKELKGMSYIKGVAQKTEVEPIIPLSKKGKNVIVFMLDRAISGYVPYLLEEKPFLREQFDGFTYYPNTVSYGQHTNFGAPPIFGGYEYTIEGMNSRLNESLAAKHDEALKMLPVLFGENNYKVTVGDLPYAGYKRGVPDLSIFNGYPYISAHLLSGVIKNDELEVSTQELPLYRNNRNLFCYSIFKTLPLAVSKIFYNKGNYFGSKKDPLDNMEGLIKEYSVLTLLRQLTKIEDSTDNTFLSIQNGTPHEPAVFQLPDYTLSGNVDNTGFKTAADGHILMNTEERMAHYHANMATFLQLGKWFDFMRENGVYDNTRIILVADHGDHSLHQFNYMFMKKLKFDVQGVNPLLMVKDFNATGFATSDEFMTNADVPSIAVRGVIEKPKNPFTGKEISDKEKTAHPQVITTSHNNNINKNNGNIFDTSDGKLLGVHDDIFNPDNWEEMSP